MILLAKGIELSDWVGSFISALVGGLIAIFIALLQNKQQREYMKKQNELDRRKSEFNLFNDYVKNIQDTIEEYVSVFRRNAKVDSSELRLKKQQETYIDELKTLTSNLKKELSQTRTLYNEMIDGRDNEEIINALNEMIDLVTSTDFDLASAHNALQSNPTFSVKPIEYIKIGNRLNELSFKFNIAVTKHLVKRLNDTYK